MQELSDISKYQPAGHKIVVKYNEVKSDSGILLPPSADKAGKKQGWFGTVVAISPGADLKDAGCPDLKPGDVIDTDCILKHCRTFEINGEVWALINDGDICGIVK